MENGEDKRFKAELDSRPANINDVTAAVNTPQPDQPSHTVEDPPVGRSQFERWMAAMGALTAIFLLISLFLVAFRAAQTRPSVPISKEEFIERQWDFLDNAGRILATVIRFSPDGRARGLETRDWIHYQWRVENGNIALYTKDAKPLAIFDAAGIVKGWYCLQGRDANANSTRTFLLRRRLPVDSKALCFAVLALIVFTLLAYVGVYLTRVMTLAEAAALSAIVFAALLIYSQDMFSSRFGVHPNLSLWMRQAAFRHVDNGLAYTKGLDISSNAPAPLQLGLHDGHHPPGFGLLLATVYWLTSAPHDDLFYLWLMPTVFHAMGAVFFFAFLRRFWGVAPALLALCVYLFIPLSVHQGRIAMHEAPTMALAMAGLFFAAKYLETAHAKHLWPAILCFCAACAMGWPGFFYCAALGLTALFLPRAPLKSRLTLFFFLGFCSSAVLALLLLQQVVFLGSLDALLGAGALRITNGGMTQYNIHYSTGEWFQRFWEFWTQWNVGLPVSLAAALGVVLLAVRNLSGRNVLVGWAFWALFITGIVHIFLFHFGSFNHNFWQFYLIPPLAIAVASVPFDLFKQRPLRLFGALVIFGLLCLANFQLAPVLAAVLSTK